MSLRFEIEGIVLRLHSSLLKAQNHAQPFLDAGETPVPVFLVYGWLCYGSETYRLVDADGVVDPRTKGYYRMLPTIFDAEAHPAVSRMYHPQSQSRHRLHPDERIDANTHPSDHGQPPDDHPCPPASHP